MTAIWVLGVYLKYAIDKYGKEHFIKEIICECSSEEEMNLKEEKLVNPEFVARDDTYNLSVGGNGGKRRGDVFADKMKNPEYRKEYCEKNKQRMLQLLSDEEWRKNFSQKISNGLKKFYKTNHGAWHGRKHSEETKQKIGRTNSIRQKGTNNSRYGTCWIYNEELKQSKSINKKDLQNWLDNGWKKGRKMYANNTNSSFFWITNGIDNKMTTNPIPPEGWKKGRTI